MRHRGREFSAVRTRRVEKLGDHHSSPSVPGARIAWIEERLAPPCDCRAICLGFYARVIGLQREDRLAQDAGVAFHRVAHSLHDLRPLSGRQGVGLHRSGARGTRWKQPRYEHDDTRAYAQRYLLPYRMH